MPKNSNPRGLLTVAGKKLRINYDIPGVHTPKEVAGGVVWFRREDRHLISPRDPFQLETAGGAKVRGSIALIHAESAAVVVQTM